MGEVAAHLGDWLHDTFVRRADFWMVMGLLAQALFFTRFLVQWAASERAGRSVIPMSFWILSIAGSGFLLVYGIQREDPVIIAGQAPGFLVYARNLWLIRRERQTTPDR